MLNFTLVSTERVSVLTDESPVLAPAAGGHGWEAAMGPCRDVGPEEWAQERLKLSLLPLAPGN